MASISKVARLGAEWWAEKLSDVSNDENFQNNESDPNHNFRVRNFSTIRAMEHAASMEELEEFSERLAKKIAEELKSHGKCVVSTDYNADKILGSIADECGISPLVFPYWRKMWITPKKITIQDGCNAAIVQIYPEPAERGRCREKIDDFFD